MANKADRSAAARGAAETKRRRAAEARVSAGQTFETADRPLGAAGDWLAFGSNHAPLRVWVGLHDATTPAVATSRIDVDRALGDLGTPADLPLPPGAAAARTVPGFDVLHELLRRAYQLARTLPDELLRDFEAKTRDLPRATEAERLVIQRVGQDVFRAGLMECWEGRCAVTGLAVPELLRASHIKPWAACVTDAERLDVFNGLLLAAHLDAAFDGGLITVADDGTVVIAETLNSAVRALLTLDRPLSVKRLTDAHRRYLEWHRANEFNKRGS